MLAWYDRHRRRLPWRALPGEPADPYRVWLSEVMLQQTGVKAVIPYFLRFTGRWPTVGSLAATDDAALMDAWAGLGYYARARKLLECARLVAEAHGGRFPDTEEGLRALPGIGAYTAAAVAAIAFGRSATVVDANIERVLARVFAVEAPLPGAKAEIRRLAATLTPAERPGDYAQALMDLGATVCTPRKPACALCPWNGACLARRRGDPDGFPRFAPKPERPLREGLAFWLVRADGAVLLRRRPPRGLLGGMAEVPGSAWSATLDRAAALAEAPLPGIAWHALPGRARHGFTHFELAVEVLAGAVPADAAAPPGAWWQPLDRIDAAGLPTAMRKVAAHALGGTPASSK